MPPSGDSWGLLICLAADYPSPVRPHQSAKGYKVRRWDPDPVSRTHRLRIEDPKRTSLNSLHGFLRGLAPIRAYWPNVSGAATGLRNRDRPPCCAAACDRGKDRQSRSFLLQTRIKPLLKDPMIEFLGEIGDSDKGAFLGDAMALLTRTVRPCADRSDGQCNTGDRLWERVRS